MSTNKINTASLQKFINQIKGADLANQKEIRIPLSEAKTLSYTLSLLLTRVAGNYEDLLTTQQSISEIANISMDGGTWDQK